MLSEALLDQRGSSLLPAHLASIHFPSQALIPKEHLAAQTLPYHLLPKNPPYAPSHREWQDKGDNEHKLGDGWPTAWLEEDPIPTSRQNTENFGRRRWSNCHDIDWR